jgi:hypothetical protein
MLSPQDFSVGCVGDATGLALVLPRGRYEHPFLVTAASGPAVAVFLEGQHQFAMFECASNTSWKGMIVPNIAIELDEASVFDAEGYYPPLGTMVRKDETLTIVAKISEGIRSTGLTPVLTGLPPCREKMAAGFTRWQIVLGQGRAKRVLKTVEITQKPVD